MPQRSGYEGADFDIPEKNTKNRILDISTRLFAQKGFKATSLVEIARESGIQQPTLYKHYESKNALIQDVLRRFERIHKAYNAWLRKELEKASSVQDAMDALFNDSFMTSVDPVGRLCMSIVTKEQHNSKPIYCAALKTLYGEAIQNIAEGFDRLIAKGVVPPSDTHTLASVFMFCTMSFNAVHIHEGADTVTPFDRSKFYSGLRAMMTVAISQGVIPEAWPDR